MTMYGYKRPKSRLLIRGIVKDVARMYVENGVAPRGSIWCPGDINGDPGIGELYAPDPAWQKPWPLGSKPESVGSPPDAAARQRMAEMQRKFHAGIPVNDDVAQFWARMAPFWASGSPAYVGLTKGTPPQPKSKTDAEILADLEAHASDPIGPVTPAMLRSLEQRKKLAGQTAGREPEGGT